MDITESATRTPNRALLQSEFSTYRGVLRGMSECADRAYLNDVAPFAGNASSRGRNGLHPVAVHRLESGSDLRSVQANLGHPSLATTHRSTPVRAERLSSAFQEVHPRA